MLLKNDLQELITKGKTGLLEAAKEAGALKDTTLRELADVGHTIAEPKMSIEGPDSKQQECLVYEPFVWLTGCRWVHYSTLNPLEKVQGLRTILSEFTEGLVQWGAQESCKNVAQFFADSLAEAIRELLIKRSADFTSEVSRCCEHVDKLDLKLVVTKPLDREKVRALLQSPSAIAVHGGLSTLREAALLFYGFSDWVQGESMPLLTMWCSPAALAATSQAVTTHVSSTDAMAEGPAKRVGLCLGNLSGLQVLASAPVDPTLCGRLKAKLSKAMSLDEAPSAKKQVARMIADSMIIDLLHEAASTAAALAVVGAQ